MTRAQFRELVDDLKRRNASPAPFVEALDLIAQVDPALTSVQKILRYADIMEEALKQLEAVSCHARGGEKPRDDSAVPIHAILQEWRY